MQIESKLIEDSRYFTNYTQQFIEKFIDYSPKLIWSFLVLFVGLYGIRFVNRLIRKIMLRRNVDPTLSKFVADVLLWVLRILLFVTFISQLGIETTSFVAILGAAGLAISLSLQGSLSNFAGGMLIILFKPFRVGDDIEAQGVSGTVAEIQIFVTKLITGNNQTIFIPNGTLSNGTIINYSMQGRRRASLLFSVSYDVNLKEVKDIIMEIMQSNPKVLKNPTPSILVTDLTDTAVRLSLRPWAKNTDFSLMTSEILEACKTGLIEKGIEIQPYTTSITKKN